MQFSPVYNLLIYCTVQITYFGKYRFYFLWESSFRDKDNPFLKRTLQLLYHTTQWCVFSISKWYQQTADFIFEKFIFLHFWDRLGQKFQKWPYFWAFEREQKCWNFDLKNFFCATEFRNYVFISIIIIFFIWIFKTSYEKFICRTFSWEV